MENERVAPVAECMEATLEWLFSKPRKPARAVGELLNALIAVCFLIFCFKRILRGAMECRVRLLDVCAVRERRVVALREARIICDLFMGL